MIRSRIQEVGAVPFPDVIGHRHYMVPFLQRHGLPQNVSMWQPTVDAMLAGIRTDGYIHLMVHQGMVRAGSTLRRPGLHADGWWLADIQAHGGGGGGGHSHTPYIPVHDSPTKQKPLPPIKGKIPPKVKKPTTPVPDVPWTWDMRESIILASDVYGCDGYIGDAEGDAGVGGDCSHVSILPLQKVRFLSGVAYAGNAMFLHMSTPMERDCYRTVVRLNVQGVEVH